MSNRLEVLDPISSIKFVDLNDKKDLSGPRVVNSEVFDLIKITNVSENQVDFLISFLVDLREIKRQIDAGGLSVNSIQADIVADSGNGQLMKVSSTSSIAIGLLLSKENLKKIDETNGNVFHAVRLSVNSQRKKIERTLSQKVRFAFFVSNNQNQRGQVNSSRIRNSMTFRKTFSYREEVKDFNSIKVPVKIGASVISRSQSIITIEKPKESKATGAIIYRRRLFRRTGGTEPVQPAFQRIAEIEFSNSGNVAENVASEILIDSAFPSKNPIVFSNGQLDNSFPYVYRAVPLNTMGGQPLSFAEFVTTAINDGDAIIGEKTSVLPVLSPTNLHQSNK